MPRAMFHYDIVKRKILEVFPAHNFSKTFTQWQAWGGESVYPKFSEKLLCPVACLSTYLGRTKKWREDETDIHQTLFLSFKKPHNPVTSATLSRWLKELIRQSGIKDIFGDHSVRSASTSTAKNAGLSIEMILDMALDWTNPSTFNLFYYKPTLPVSYGTSGLSQK